MKTKTDTRTKYFFYFIIYHELFIGNGAIPGLHELFALISSLHLNGILPTNYIYVLDSNDRIDDRHSRQFQK